MKNAAAKQVEFGAAVCLPLQQFQPVDLAFDGTIAPRLRQGGLNRRKVADNSGNKAVHCRGSRNRQPDLERCGIPLAQNAAEFIDCRRCGADLGYMEDDALLMIKLSDRILEIADNRNTLTHGEFQLTVPFSRSAAMGDVS